MKKLDIRHTPANEIVKYKFFEILEHNQGKDPKTVNQYVNAIHEFEVATGFKDFKKYSSDWAIEFKNYLNDKINKMTGQNISKSLYFHYSNFVKEFFNWLVKNNKDYSKIKPDDINYLGVTRNDKNKARATNYQESHEISDILSTIRNMPEGNILEMRNKAMISLCLLTTPRISSLQTSRVKSIKYFKDYDIWALIQHPALQNTKFSKNITSFFIGQSQDIIDNVTKWQKHLISEGFKDNDFLFPRITSNFNTEGKPILELTKQEIKSQSQIRIAFKTAFEANNLPYRKPHTFRHSMARKMKQGENATDRLIALAENMGQKAGFATIINSYGGDSLRQQATVLKGFRLE